MNQLNQTNQRIFVFLAVAFLLVGVAAAASSIRLNMYIQDTAPRDSAQEVCDRQTLEMVKAWMDVRSRRDVVERGRDDAVAKFLNETAATNEPTIGQLVELRDAIDDYQRAWGTGGLNFPMVLPDCDGVPD